MDLLGTLSANMDYTLPALLIGNIVTSIISNNPTNLQIALGNLIRDSKSLINQMYQFGVTCSYDEILQFKKSAALAATNDIQLSGIHEGDGGLIQTLVDNFNADISSQNRRLTTHSLAMLITQPCTQPNKNQNIPSTIPRVSKADMSQQIDFELPIQRYQGPKKVLKVLCSCIIAKERAEELDFSFMSEINSNDNCPEFNGFNTSIAREHGQALKPKTQAVYLPLIDMLPSDPDTMMTALQEAKRLTNERGQKKVVFTCDQQLYKVAADVKWAYPNDFSDVILRLGGMHMLMSSVGAIGSLMAGSGLSEILSSTFAGVSKMLTGKKFTQNVRAMRLVSEELLRNIINRGDVMSMEDLLAHLDAAARKSKTSKLWVDCFIKPVFLMMLYVRAERESDWPLHLVAVKRMLPYFFASGHVNYARYGLYYFRSMESLQGEELSMFMRGEHVMHHVPGLWNGIWSDMYIETTFMRYGHGPGGIIRITLKPEMLKTWALGLHVCCQLEQDTVNLSCNEQDKCQLNHKEEAKSRIKSDRADSENLSKKLELCIDPRDHASHPPSILNIVSGQIANDTVNVHDVVAIGTKKMQKFENRWPKQFNETISKWITTISD